MNEWHLQCLLSPYQELHLLIVSNVWSKCNCLLSSTCRNVLARIVPEVTQYRFLCRSTVCQSGTQCSHITVASGFSSVWVQTLPPICISAATKVVLAQRLQSLLLLSPGWIQSSAGVNTALRFWKEIQIHPSTVRKTWYIQRFICIADRNVHQIVFFYITSGKTEYQTTKASKARRSASFERRPSRRYSRRTMQNRGKNTNDTSHYTLATSIVITHLYTWWLESEFSLCFLCVRRTTECPWVSICVLCVQA